MSRFAKSLLPFLLGACACLAQVRYTPEGKMQKPDNYREWIFLSSGFGMAYGPLAEGKAPNPDPPFDNVFVDPAAWKAFQKTGKWPDKAAFVLELRRSTGKGSITQQGHFQEAPVAVEVHVKDEKRFPATRGWGFFEFGRDVTQAAVTPAEKDCYSCHQDHGTLDSTFAQFYPTVKPIAEKMGTLTTEKPDSPKTGK